MADRLTLKGYKDVTNQTGTEIDWVQPMKGGDFHRFPRWWNRKGTIAYENVTILTISRAAGDIRLVIPTSINTHLEVIWDENTDSFKFPIHRNVDRIGVYAADGSTLLQEYQFSRIAGGSVLKRTLSSLPFPTIGTATLTGSASPEVGLAETYSISVTGDAGDIVYAWTTTDGTATLTDADTATVTVTYGTQGTFDLVCNITSGLASDSPVSETLSVTAT